jgi:putative transposase
MEELSKWADVPKSSFYYKDHPGPRGMKASTHTPKGKCLVENTEVVEDIRRVLGRDYCVYGYQIMTRELHSLGYLINKKKVYRLMDEHRLLCGRVIKTQGKRQWVKFRRIQATRPMEYLCLDIKYVWVQGEGRWYYQLAIMDVFSRRVIGWLFQPSLRHKDVIGLMRYLDLRYGLKGVIIRNDNGSQFIAQKLRQALQDMEARQEFTHVATPEENAYIEAFHSIQQRELMDRFQFQSYYNARQHISNYMYWYNHLRRHGSLKGLTPDEKWAQGWIYFSLRRPFTPLLDGWTKPANLFEKWMKVQRLCNGLDIVKTDNQFYSTEKQSDDLVVNSFAKTVQLMGG